MTAPRRALAFDPLFFERDPLYWPIAPAASLFSQFTSWPSVGEYTSRVPHRAPVRFREQPPRPRRRRRAAVTATDLYDGCIALQGWVPTRPASWHDYLNMLVWAAFPDAKWQLHGRQHRAQAARIHGAVQALPNARTREQDALALLDEGGIAVMCRRDSAAELAAALASRSEGATRAALQSGDAAALLFGHALYESLVAGHDGVWGAAFLVPHDGALDRSPPELVRAADAGLASALADSDSFATPACLARLDLALLRP